MKELCAKHLMCFISVLKTVTEQDSVHHYHSLPFTVETSERLRSFSKECWGAGFESEDQALMSPVITVLPEN